MFLQLTALIGLLLVLVLYVKFKRRFRFWQELGVAFLPPTFPTGNVSDFLKTSIHFSYVIQKLYVKLRSRGVDDYAGIFFFGNPVFLVLSPEFAKTVLVRDFQHFMDRGIYFNGEVDVLSANIFFLRGAKWKTLREKLTPTFSSGKLKQMFFTILDVGKRLEAHLMPFAEAKADLDIRDILGRFMTDVIASCAFGLDTDCINDPKSRFRVMGKKMIHFPKSKALKLIFASTFQRQARALGIRWNDEDVSEFFMSVVRDTIAYRKSSGERRNDFMQLLIDMMRDDECAGGDGSESKSPTNNGLLTLEEIAAQAFLFFFAGSVIFLSSRSSTIVNLSACRHFFCVFFFLSKPTTKSK